MVYFSAMNDTVLHCLLYWKHFFVFPPVFGSSVHYLSSLLSRSVCDRRLTFSVTAWKVITVLTCMCLSWQSRCLYLALSVIHSICTFISCFVSFSHMLSQALSFRLLPSIPVWWAQHSIPPQKSVGFEKADGQSHHRGNIAKQHCLIQTGKVGERTWNEMRDHE